MCVNNLPKVATQWDSGMHDLEIEPRSTGSHSKCANHYTTKPTCFLFARLKCSAKFYPSLLANVCLN